MKILLILILLLFPVFLFGQSDEDTLSDNAAKARIDSVIEQRDEKSDQTFTVKKRKYTEKWTYSVVDGNIESFAISYFTRKTAYTESYHLQNGQLIYADESEEYFSGNDENTERLTGWSGVYYFENQKLVYLMTNGHGKSETDDWEPEKETLNMFRSRLKTLKKKIKKSLGNEEITRGN